MHIRFATIHDKSAVLGVLHELTQHVYQQNTPRKESESDSGKVFEEVIARKDTKIFVAEENNTICGVVTFYLLPNIRHGWQRGHIEDFVVSKALRGKGVGTKLFDAVKELCRNNNIHIIKLTSGNELTEAHTFYEKNGGKFTEKMFRFEIA